MNEDYIARGLLETIRATHERIETEFFRHYVGIPAMMDGANCPSRFEQSSRPYDDDNLTTEDILRISIQLRAELGPPAVGVTTQPAWTRIIADLQHKMWKSYQFGAAPVVTEFYGIPIYEKADQDAPWKVWYDEAAMREYLEKKPE